MVIGDVQVDRAQAVAADLGADRCLAVACDVTQEADVQKLVDAAVSTFGQLDVMVNNAGAHLAGSCRRAAHGTSAAAGLRLKPALPLPPLHP